jgi:hypothetical protein
VWCVECGFRRDFVMPDSRTEPVLKLGIHKPDSAKPVFQLVPQFETRSVKSFL